MRARPFGLRVSRSALLAVLALVVLVVPAANAVGGDEPSKTELEHVSEAVALHEYLAHPELAPSQFDAISQIQKKADRGRRVSSCTANSNKDAFNCDIFGLPQNEESISSCPTNDNFVLEGTNDYRGLIDPEGNFTGWDWSIDGGHSVQNEGLLPPVALTKIASPHTVPSLRGPPALSANQTNTNYSERPPRSRP